MMQVIPVVDLLNGEVVHAKKGHRQAYQAIRSPLCTSSDPLAIVAALMAIHPFQQLYIADLNAIQKLPHKASSNYASIRQISLAYPELELWLDAGIQQSADLLEWQKLNVRIILASENFHNMQDYLALSQQQPDFILSLDFFSDGFHGPQALFKQTEDWPEQVIIMSLSDVGTNQGFNKARLVEIMQSNKGSLLYAAGGVRDEQDLLSLKALGVHGALVASALHNQQINGASLIKLSL
jgi:phosphoribosylformimino-5-aminoimidazole carboxamide ribotide isomerase